MIFFSDIQNIYSDIENNLDNFKSSINELSNMAEFYLSIFNTNITQNYFDSIEKHQKSEFNYTISYYYNSLLQNITSVYQYISNQIQTNQEGFNTIINIRKNEVEEKFSKIFKTVKESKIDSLSINKQLYVLKVSSSNFFEYSSFLIEKSFLISKFIL